MIERAGWVLERWTVSGDAGGGQFAFPVFRRGDGRETPSRIARITGDVAARRAGRRASQAPSRARQAGQGVCRARPGERTTEAITEQSGRGLP